MEENYYETPVSKANLKAVSKRRYAMIILKFLTENGEETYYNAELSKLLNICEITSKQNLDKLVASGLVRKSVNNPVDKRLVCYEVTDKELAEKLVEKWKRHIGHELSKFVPDSKITSDALKMYKGYVNVCHKYRISLDEGIECLRKCPAVVSESYHGTWLFSRKEAYSEQEEVRQEKTRHVEEVEE